MEKHWKLTDETKEHFGITLHRIELIQDCKWGNKGDKGGWIEKESNLSGNAWVGGNAMVYGNAWVYGNAKVGGNARVYGDAQVGGDAWVTKRVKTLNFVHNLTLTDNHISYGCVMKTVSEWEEWLDSDEVFETPRGTDKFKLIEMSLQLAIEQHKQLNK